MSTDGGFSATPAGVLSAGQVIQPHVWRTPLVPSPPLDRLTDGHVRLKPECWQPTGSFKIRGAIYKLASLTTAQLQRGIVTASAGNGGLGVAYACRVLGLPPALVFVPENTPATKLERLSGFDCTVRRAGADYDSSHALAVAYAEDRDAVYISAYDDPLVIAGQGTVGLELISDWPDADVVLVPVGGGGLIAGVAMVVKALQPRTRVVGLQPEASPAAYLSLRDGVPYETYAAKPTICDGLAGGFGRVPFELASELIDEIVVVPERAIRQAVAWLLAEEQMVVEGSGAIAVAPLLSGQIQVAGLRVVAVLTGRNLDAGLLQQILEESAAT